MSFDRDRYFQMRCLHIAMTVVEGVPYSSRHAKILVRHLTCTAELQRLQ